MKQYNRIGGDNIKRVITKKEKYMITKKKGLYCSGLLLLLFGLVPTTSLVCMSPPLSILITAIENKEPLERIEKIIEEGPDVNDCFCEKFGADRPLLRYALDRGTDEESISIIKLLIQKNANVNVDTYKCGRGETYCGYMPLLNYAVIYSSPEVVQLLIDAKANPNEKPKELLGLGNRFTALELARTLKESAERTEKIKILTEAGAGGSKYDIAQLLINAGADPNQELDGVLNNKFTALNQKTLTIVVVALTAIVTIGWFLKFKLSNIVVTLKPGQTIIFDNSSFHKSGKNRKAYSFSWI